MRKVLLESLPTPEAFHVHRSRMTAVQRPTSAADTHCAVKAVLVVCRVMQPIPKNWPLEESALAYLPLRQVYFSNHTGEAIASPAAGVSRVYIEMLLSLSPKSASVTATTAPIPVKGECTWSRVTLAMAGVYSVATVTTAIIATEAVFKACM